MIAYLKAHPEDFDEAVCLAIADKQPWSWRAAWLLWSCMENNDQRVRRFVKKIVDALPAKGDNQLRELLMILQRMELRDDIEGRLFDFCVSVWETTGKVPSVRFNAFRLIVKIVKKHPELAKEIDFMTESQYMDSLSVTVQKSILRMMAGIPRR
jgi:hypothetical protein